MVLTRKRQFSGTSRWLCECTDHRRESCELPDRRNKITIKDKIPENFILWDFLKRHNYEEGNKEKTGRNETTCI